MVAKVVLGLLALLVVFLGYVAVKPSEFRIARETQIDAPPGVVFAQVNDLRKFDAWNPWSKLDPASKQTFEGPPTGVGSSSSWDGNDKVGSGKMTIIESKPDTLVRMKLEFYKPFPAKDVAEFTFVPTGSRTSVTWAMSGKQTSFLPKLFCVFMNMDKMVGGEFEKGLVQLKTIAEAAAKK